ncbi:MAG: 5-carboxymethyl-2-hydroxymuconate isomerase [Candidatus Endobugula sp.]|jgi:5-carboxymethyl-2-hydroxymuconate isomerase
MPHCIIEYASALTSITSPEALIQSVHSGAVNSGLFNVADIKLRAIPFDHYMSGAQKFDAALLTSSPSMKGNGNLPFIHVCVKMLSGRTPEQRHHLSKSILEALSRLPLPSISLTVEVVEIEAQSYGKLIK